ncbi:lamin tail domain-containing protein [Compostimonas suwonensis]|uniref:Phytase-like protein with esterase activity n=1 Tax=Compostimonas suwonensis TaxID=1048394 RepID=A0A2M9BBC1_9MICO|nr:lamin tail domain-containing protein [Compostimonas suwonensis]PJJ55236.1 phytase-like protein with esterase activity [Compostimonas suwonensis]
MLNKVSRPLALTAGSTLVLAGLFAVPAAVSAAENTGQIRITEWEYNGSEFVEFTNLDTDSIDLDGWSFSDSGENPGDTDLSSAGIVAPGESFILSEESAADFRSEWNLPSSIKVVGDNSKNLGRGDAINIYNSADTLVDTLTYSDEDGKGPRTDTASAWPSTESVIGTDHAASWTRSTAGDAEGSWTSKSGYIGSPGVSRFGTAMDWLRINEIETDGSPDWAELINLSTQPLDASGYVITGRENGVTLTLPNDTIIAPGAVFVAEGGDFKLKKSDLLSLYAPGGDTLLDSYGWGDFHLDTYGRVPNGTGDFVQQETSSKGALNPEPTDPTDPDDTSWQAIKINEVTSANDDPTHDGYELVNTGDTDIDVAGWKQSDSGSNPASLDAPNGTVVPAHGFLVLLSNQGLSSDGDSVKLYLANGSTIVDSVGWGANDAQPGSWSRCGDATGAWAHTAASSWGVSNAQACAGQIIPPSNPDNGGDVPCQTEGASGGGPAIAGGIVWPGSQDWTVADNECQFVTSISGQDVSGLDIDPSDPDVMWAAKNKSSIYRLVKSGDLWVPDTTNGWATGKNIVFPTGGGQPDSEGITVGPDGFLYVTTERDNTANDVPLESVLRFDPNASGTTLQATNQWVLTADLADAITSGSADSNLGFEGLTWVPDSYLTTNGFVDQSTSAAYDPADYPGHGTGLFFLALEKNGHLYAYALNADGTFHRIGSIDSGLPMIQETQWDPDAQRIWAVADNTSAGSTTLLKIDSEGAFAVDRIYNRPTGLPDYNLEGFAIAPNSTCAGGVKEVIRSDDGNNGGHSLWSGTIACDLELGPQGPNPPAEIDPTVTATPSTVQAGGTTTIAADGLAADTQYTVVLNSEPVTLGSAVADAEGTLTLEDVVIPADTTPGAHTITVAASSDLTTVIASAELEVTPAATDDPTPTPTPSSSASTTPTDNGSKPAGLASTGAEPLPWIAISALLLLLGGGLVFSGLRTRRGNA